MKFRNYCKVLVFCLATAIALPAQTFTKLVNFNGTNGGQPFYGPLVQGLDGNLYGTTYVGGTYSAGTVFRMTLQGKLKSLHSFNGGDGQQPMSGLTLGTDGNFYGTTMYGGLYDWGEVFKITPSGALTILYSFCPSQQQPCRDGNYPIGGLVQGTDGNFYGTTSAGGTANTGTVFKITPKGTLTTLNSFCVNCADGYDPTGTLVEGSDGNFYGTTVAGGANGGGVFFEITPSGTLSTLWSFCSYNVPSPCFDGQAPNGAPTPDGAGHFWVTTPYGGVVNGGSFFMVWNPSSSLQVWICALDGSCPYGYSPIGGLTFGTDGKAYGTMSLGGANNGGTVFSWIPPRRALEVVASA